MLEREYVVPLRREFLKTPRYKRTNKAVTALRSFMVKHMKSNDVSIGSHLNQELWKNGIKNPPHKVTVKATKDDSGKVFVELKEIPVTKPRVNKRLARVEKSESSEGSKKEESKDAKKEDAKAAVRTAEKSKDSDVAKTDSKSDTIDEKVDKETKAKEPTKASEKPSDKKESASKSSDSSE